MIITSRENRIYKLALSLREKRMRDRNGLFMIEGVRSVADAVKNGAHMEYVITCDGFSCEKIPCENSYVFSPRLFRELSDTVNPQGVIGLCRIPHCTLESIAVKEGGCVILCEALQDPGNIGTIIRTAHAACCDGVVLSRGCCDLYNPKIIRATMSAVFSIPVVNGAETDEAVDYFKKRGYTAAAGALTNSASSLYECDLSGKTLIIIGNEGRGVTGQTLRQCDKIIKIPMRPDAESLNASVAAAVIVYEQYRQKNSVK